MSIIEYYVVVIFFNFSLYVYINHLRACEKYKVQGSLSSEAGLKGLRWFSKLQS